VVHKLGWEAGSRRQQIVASTLSLLSDRSIVVTLGGNLRILETTAARAGMSRGHMDIF
jgi:hypothetical protein